jgi:hypothetical protein
MVNPIYQLAIVVAFIKDCGRILDGFRPEDQIKLHRCVGFVANSSGYILWGFG